MRTLTKILLMSLLVLVGALVLYLYLDNRKVVIGDRLAIVGICLSITSLVSTMVFSFKTFEYSRIQASAAESQTAAALIERRATIADDCYALILEVFTNGILSPESIARFQAITITRAEWLLSEKEVKLVKKLLAQARLLGKETHRHTRKMAFVYITKYASAELAAALAPYQAQTRKREH